ncbi:LuxR C-terminal-related transcriptional regulator [Paenibacillus sp. G2S3]|uniref:response regulator transcription factor n=1 Tax=Paenibacillus sp. G2S3 TaxID=3047872 RepID=UPI0024C161A0|nr:LuxR C-terminal-related transcriptional regulator [Paenibacillus sp. G2S3]WHY19833.1 LuxR C-terminal-related transcriptional regulator [Paenibacillus sp. G2S3]
MISHTIIQERVRNMESTSSHEEQLYKMLQEYIHIFPVFNAYLYRYSPLGYLSEGIFGYTQTGLVHIREYRDDIRSSPIVYAAINERKAKYTSGLDYLKQTSSKYIIGSGAGSLIIVPIFLHSLVIGYICSTELSEGAIIDKEMLSAFTLYGKLIGGVIDKFNPNEESNVLSKRELEVMQKISSGENTKQIAESLQISPATVSQYVKSAVNKLCAKNRSHAVAILFRQGIIT